MSMTEAGCQTAGMNSGFPFQRGKFFVKHYTRNPYVRNEEESWLFEDTNMADRSPPSIGPVGRNRQVHDMEHGASAERSRSPGISREASTLDEDDQIMEIKEATFLRWSILKELLFLLSCLLTGGTVMIVFSTWPRLYTKARFARVSQMDDDAERVLVESMDGDVTLVDIMWIREDDSEKSWMKSSRARFTNESISNRPRMFIWREERFWFNNESGTWTRRHFNTDVTYAELHSVGSNCALKEIGHDPEENKLSDSRERRNLVYGPNQLTVHAPSFWQLLFAEVFKPFFLFQAFSIAFWLCSNYEIYAYVILFLTTLSVLYNVFETRRNLLAVKELAASECEVKRLTLVADEAAQLQLRPVLVSSSELLPGDIVQVEPGMVFPCDMVLLVGQCVVNESMLTGESAPVPKTPLPLGYSSFGQVFRKQSERDGRYKLLSGTKALQVRHSPNPHLSFSNYELDSLPQPASIWQFVTQRSSDLDRLASREPPPVAAMVISTAYGTAKGQLVRAILFPKPSKYDFEKKLYYFVANLAVYLVVTCAITVMWQIGKESNLEILENCIDLITIGVPPALPLALSIGLSVSFTRLQGKSIYCINPKRIINAGRINTLCFDKTGTLTEDGLSLKGVLPVMYDWRIKDSAVVKCGDLEEDLQALYFRSFQGKKGQSEQRHANQKEVCGDQTTLASLGLFYSMTASHSISLLDQPADPDKLNREVQTELHGHQEPGWKAWLCKGWKASGSGSWYSAQGEQDPDFAAKGGEEEMQDMNLFVGDPLEVQMFSKTGWRYLSRPDYEPGYNEEDFDSPVIWANLHPSIDTVMIPPSDADSRQILAVIKRFDFDSEIRLMSSVVLELPYARASFEESRVWLLVKGAPENVQEACSTASVPQDFDAQLQDLTLSGYRVLACGFRLLGSMTLQQIMVANRNQMETGLVFSGFLVMENKLKAETPAVLLELARSGLREVMVTGDNPLTAISVARQCGPFFLRNSCRTFLIDRPADHHSEPLKSGCLLKDLDSERQIDFDSLFPTRITDMIVNPAKRTEILGVPILQNTLCGLGAVNIVITGRAFSALSTQQDEIVEKLMEETGAAEVKTSECVTPFQMVLTQANIFSRMSPQNKLELMQGLQDLGYVVCMTGDGANDSAALKAADVGISIASKPMEVTDTMRAGPSIAAPFNTKLSHIGVVRAVLSEGRCALVNATVMFKYMYFYALIQATAVMVLYRYDLVLSSYQYLWADMGLVFPMVLFMPATPPRKELSRGRPESNLLAFPVLLSVYGQSLFIVIFQAATQLYLLQQSWYENPYSKTRQQHDADDDTYKYHNQNSTVSFLFSSFQYVSMAMALSQSFGKFRRSPLSNLPLIATIICLYVLCSIFLLRPMSFSIKAFSLVDLSPYMSFLCSVWILAAGNSLLFILFERYAIKHQSTEMDVRTVYDEEMEYEDSLPPKSFLQKTIVALSGEDDCCTGVFPVIPGFYRVAAVAAPIWARLTSY